jgi:hypothetical protein
MPPFLSLLLSSLTSPLAGASLPACIVVFLLLLLLGGPDLADRGKRGVSGVASLLEARAMEARMFHCRRFATTKSTVDATDKLLERFL